MTDTQFQEFLKRLESLEKTIAQMPRVNITPLITVTVDEKILTSVLEALRIRKGE